MTDRLRAAIEVLAEDAWKGPTFTLAENARRIAHRAALREELSKIDELVETATAARVLLNEPVSSGVSKAGRAVYHLDARLVFAAYTRLTDALEAIQNPGGATGGHETAEDNASEREV